MNKTSKIYYLDGIRGIAAFLVLLHHFCLAFLPAYLLWEPERSHLHNWDIVYGKSPVSILTNGNFAVCLFFVLSGFVLSRQYFLSGKIVTIISASMRRFVRLYIPVAATLLISYFLVKAGWYYNVPVGTITGGDWWMGNFWVMDNPESKLFIAMSYSAMFGGDSYFDTSLWTISIEFYGSMLVFAFLALTHNIRNRGAALLAALAYFISFGQYYYVAFILGIALHLIKPWQIRRGPARTILSTALFVLGLLFGGYPSNGVPQETILRFIPPNLAEMQWFHVAGSVTLITGVLMSPRLQHFFSLRLFRFLGYISFCLYLLHALVIGSVACFLFLKLYQQIGYMPAVVVAFLATVAVVMLASYLMATAIDDKGIQLSKWLYRRWFHRAESEQAVDNEAELAVPRVA